MLREDIYALCDKHGVTLGDIDAIVYAMKGDRILELKEAGLSWNEIADSIGVPSKTARNRYNKCLKVPNV